MKQLQIKIVTRLTILGFRNRFGASKVSQPPEPEFSIKWIEFPMFVVEAPASIMMQSQNMTSKIVVKVKKKRQVLRAEGKKIKDALKMPILVLEESRRV